MTNAEARFNKIHIRKVYACLAVTCHLHFWQNDRDFLRATAVTRGWNGYRNKSQHRKSTLEKKILPPFQQGFEPATFQSRVRCSNHWAIPAPWAYWMLFNPFIANTTQHPTLRASLSGTFLQTLPDLVTPLKGQLALYLRGSCPATRSAPSERFGY